MRSELSPVHKSESFAYALAKYAASMKRNPVALAMFFTLYAVSTLVIVFYQRQERETVQLQSEILNQRKLLASLKEEHSFAAAKAVGTNNLDLFKNLSFKETSTPGNQDKLEEALRLNSFAMYAIHNRDFEKAKE